MEGKNSESIKEKIRFSVEMVKLGVFISTAVGGGAAGLLLNLNTQIKVVLFFTALLILISSVLFSLTSFLKALEYLKRLEEIENE